VNIKECVAPESNKTDNGLGFEKRVLVTIVPEFEASLLLIMYALPTVGGF